jgi:hypothetical protein
MDRALPSLNDDDEVDDVNNTPTVPGVYIMPEWGLAEPGTDPLLEDPASWDSAEDTKRFRIVG